MSGAPEHEQTFHGTAIAMAGKAVLIRGPSGSGKSDFALRCLGLGTSILLPHPVHLVCDDRAVIQRHDHQLIVSAPSQIWGKLEVRGVGIASVPAVSSARLVLVADLVDQDVAIERLPDPVHVELAGLAVAWMNVHPFEASAPLKLLLALQGAGGGSV